ncbi:MAG TPA: hypothetical protein PL084_12070, partial [Chitinophagales bacterium]|nr:hypothetical protein [Chitinophagales bacterium]
NDNAKSIVFIWVRNFSLHPVEICCILLLLTESPTLSPQALCREENNPKLLYSLHFYIFARHEQRKFN